MFDGILRVDGFRCSQVFLSMVCHCEFFLMSSFVVVYSMSLLKPFIVFVVFMPYCIFDDVCPHADFFVDFLYL